MAKKEKASSEAKPYNMDSSTLASKLKTIQEESNKRRQAAAAERAVARAQRRQTMNKKGGQGGSSVQGLNTSLGGKIITK